MAEEKGLKPGDPCPTCGGSFVVDESQDPAALVNAKRRNAASPSAADRYADAVMRKVAEAGLLHRCDGCGYRARFAAKRKAA